MKRVLTAAERRLWERVAATARPLAGRSIVASESSISGSPKARASVAAPTRIAKGAPADRSEDRRVRRGQIDVDAKLDLHGHRQDAARTRLLQFITRRRASGARVVLVVTGKGGSRDPDPLGEGRPGALKRALPLWLAQPEFRRHVSGFAPAHRRHGGIGAAYVFLRRAD